MGLLPSTKRLLWFLDTFIGTDYSCLSVLYSCQILLTICLPACLSAYLFVLTCIMILSFECYLLLLLLFFIVVIGFVIVAAVLTAHIKHQKLLLCKMYSIFSLSFSSFLFSSLLFFTFFLNLYFVLLKGENKVKEILGFSILL